MYQDQPGQSHSAQILHFPHSEQINQPLGKKKQRNLSQYRYEPGRPTPRPTSLETQNFWKIIGYGTILLRQLARRRLQGLAPRGAFIKPFTELWTERLIQDERMSRTYQLLKLYRPALYLRLQTEGLQPHEEHLLEEVKKSVQPQVDVDVSLYAAEIAPQRAAFEVRRFLELQPAFDGRWRDSWNPEHVASRYAAEGSPHSAAFIEANNFLTTGFKTSKREFDESELDGNDLKKAVKSSHSSKSCVSQKAVSDLNRACDPNDDQFRPFEQSEEVIFRKVRTFAIKKVFGEKQLYDCEREEAADDFVDYVDKRLKNTEGRYKKYEERGNRGYGWLEGKWNGFLKEHLKMLERRRQGVYEDLEQPENLNSYSLFQTVSQDERNEELCWKTLLWPKQKLDDVRAQQTHRDCKLLDNLLTAFKENEELTLSNRTALASSIAVNVNTMNSAFKRMYERSQLFPVLTAKMSKSSDHSLNIHLRKSASHLAILRDEEPHVKITEWLAKREEHRSSVYEQRIRNLDPCDSYDAPHRTGVVLVAGGLTVDVGSSNPTQKLGVVLEVAA